MERREAVEEGGEVTEEGMEMERSEAGEEKRPTWLGAVLQGALCHLFQRLALEGDKENTDLALQVWENIVGVCDPAELSGACECLLMSWLCLSASPSGSPVDPSLLTRAHQGSHGDVYLGGSLGVESVQQKDEQAFAARVNTAKALGHLAAKMTSSPSPSPISSTPEYSTPSSDTHSTTPDPTTKTTTTPPQLASAPGYPNPTTPGYFTPASTTLTEGLGQMLTRSSSTHRIVAALTIGYWGVCPSQLLSGLNTKLTERTTYEEILPFLMTMQRECHSLVLAFDKNGVSVASGANVSGYTVEYAAQLSTTVFEAKLQTMSLSSEEKQEFESLRRNVLTALGQLQEEQQRCDTRVHCCVTGTLILLASLPPKLNPVIRPLMDCLKSESDPLLQSLAAQWISNLLDLCKERSPGPVTKIIKNLCSFSCVDPRHTPPARPARAGADSTLSEGAAATGKKGAAKSKKKRGSPSGGSANEEAWSSGTGTGGYSTWTWDSGIITLVRQQKELSSHRIPQGRGRPSAAVREALAAAATQQANLPQQYQRRGGEAALRAVVKYFGDRLLSTLPSLWSHITSPLHNLPSPPPATDNTEVPDEVVGAGQAVVHCLQVLEVITPSLHPSLRPRLLSLLPLILDCIKSTFTAVRHLAARCLATFTLVGLHKSMIFMVEDLLPYLGDSESVTHRQGAIETIACVLESAGLQALCYVVLLVMPVMSRMSDQDADVRLMASRCFANLVTLMPLEAGTESPKEMPEKLAQKRNTDRRFLEQLLDISKLDNYAVPVPIHADLRQYQQDGINWLAFLNKYSLHGILCDDMGLGKTLQSLCIIAGDHFHREKQYKTTGQVDQAPLPSLVICPPTLIGHWYYEVCKFCRLEDLSPLQYSGPPSTRARLQSLVPNHNLVIASYDIIRNDVDFFRSITWNYCVLDEGHIIKNTKTKITKAVKQLRANHRLILSGTPIQNNVLELWSLFDFLLPGFLGTERQFFERFGKPILLSRDAKSSSKEQEAGALAMESLHKQVLPFLLRRMKEDVLQDLPPKIIQDYHCELSPLQVKLYEDFACSKAKKEVEDTLAEDEEGREGRDRCG
ncbi:TATA-binding protein-associated factor 172 [Geodia barretti]|uniref:TATA-binding protein-associated factor 172 n=1 Tax=Geodia barretti TaxID=519541 RepID=A0AA35SSH5_GEOBA|nr:TATA-binding protein-associated factor 172 [Geodia barretti]